MNVIGYPMIHPHNEEKIQRQGRVIRPVKPAFEKYQPETLKSQWLGGRKVIPKEPS
jgi:hypothetical protein